jgi:hypothetical protein
MCEGLMTYEALPMRSAAVRDAKSPLVKKLWEACGGAQFALGLRSQAH